MHKVGSLVVTHPQSLRQKSSAAPKQIPKTPADDLSESEINEGDEAGGGSIRNDIMQEIRALSAHVQRECREAIEEGFRGMGDSLRNDMRQEIGRVEQAIRSSGQRPASQGRGTQRTMSFGEGRGTRRTTSLGEETGVSAVDAAHAASLRQAASTTYRIKSGRTSEFDEAQLSLGSPGGSADSTSSIRKPHFDHTVTQPKGAPQMLTCEIPGAIQEDPSELRALALPLATSTFDQKHSGPHADNLSQLQCFDGRSTPSDTTPPVDDTTGKNEVRRDTLVLDRQAQGWDMSAVLREHQKEELGKRDGKKNVIDITRERARLEAKKKKSHGPLHVLSIAELIKTPMFENLVGFVILLNAAVIGFQTDYGAKEITDYIPVPYFVFEQIFAVWFTFELLLRVWVFRLRFWKPGIEGWLWNYFDTLVVGAQLVEILIEVALRSTSVDAKNLRVLRILRILRLVRILRVVRVLHLISELRAIVSSIIGSLRSLVWVVVLLSLMIYIVAVFFTQSVTEHLINMKDAGNELTGDDLLLAKYFGGMGRAILSLWQAMSGGMDWDTLADPLFTKVNFITGMAFACFIAFALLALMNVVTGVFVQTALLSARDEEDNFMTQQILNLFHMAEREKNSAMITWDEIEESVTDPSSAAEWNSVNIGPEDARYLFTLLDMEAIGEVAFEEFLGGCLRLSGAAKAIDVLTVMQEARKNEEKMVRSFIAVTSALIEINDNVRKLSYESLV